MDINRQSLDALFKGFNLQFQSGLDAAPATWNKFCGVAPSSTSTAVYPFLEQFGGMREWIGDRQIKNIASQKIEVVNRDFEDTVSIRRNDIEDDQYGLYGTMIAQMGQNAAMLWQELAVESILSNPVWVDGKTFFASDRAYGENSISNTTASALSAESYAAARKAMMEYKGHSNKMLAVVPNLMIVGPKNEATAFSILKDRSIVAGATDKAAATDNPWMGSAEYIVMPELSGDYDDLWFLCSTVGVLKPMMVQQRQTPRLVRLDRETDENVFLRKEYIYGADARGAAFLAFPHLIYKGGTGA